MTKGSNLSRVFAMVLACLGLCPDLPAQDYNFSAATNILQDNLHLYGSNILALVYQGDREILRYQHGDMTPDSKHPIASATKWFSGTIVLKVAEQGYFDLDDPIGQYLPLFEAQGKGHPTIRQCFALTSGLVLEDPEYEQDWRLTLETSVNMIASNTPIVFEPGTQLAYECDGMQVVGRICEVVTGKPWRTLASELLFDPLGMTQSDYWAMVFNPGIGGGAKSSPRDYIQLLNMIMNNGRLPDGSVYMPSRTVQEFFTNQSKDLPEYYSPWPPYFYPYLQRPDYGIGAWIQAQNPSSGLVEEVCSPGKFGTYPWVDRKRNLRGIVFMNQPDGFVMTMYPNLNFLAAIRSEIDRVGLPPEPPHRPLSIECNGQVINLDWHGTNVLAVSPDLQTWTPLPWARAPFYEFIEQAAARRYYRLQ